MLLCYCAETTYLVWLEAAHLQQFWHVVFKEVKVHIYICKWCFNINGPVTAYCVFTENLCWKWAIFVSFVFSKAHEWECLWFIIPPLMNIASLENKIQVMICYLEQASHRIPCVCRLICRLLVKWITVMVKNSTYSHLWYVCLLRYSLNTGGWTVAYHLEYDHFIINCLLH